MLAIFTTIFIFASGSELIGQTLIADNNKQIEVNDIDYSQNSSNTNSESFETDLIVYPQVFTNELNFAFQKSGNDPIIIEIYNSMGELVISHKLLGSNNTGHIQLQTNELKSDIYKVIFKTDHRVINKTITKN